MPLKSYRVTIDNHVITTIGGSPRIAISKALKELYVHKILTHRGVDISDNQLRLGQLLQITCSREGS